MEEPIKMPEPCCSCCEFGRYDEETDRLICTNELQVFTEVEKDSYCFYFEYPF